MIVPLTARNRTLGAVGFVASAAARRYDAASLTLAEDLARRVALAVDNARLYDASQEMVRRRDEFLAMLSHELRNPLGAILHASQLLSGRSESPAALQRSREVVERQGRDMARLLDDLLDISRVTHGKIELRKQTLDLSAVLVDAIQTNQPGMDAHGHSLVVTLPGEPLWVDADPTRLGQIVSNLLSNAAKYTRPHGRLGVTLGREGSQAVLRVRDDGVGIPPEMLSSIFELFTQVESSLERSEGGLGIGLTLVRRLVELHGGSVGAFSAGVGQGSEFVVRLPLLSGEGRGASAEKDNNAALATRHAPLATRRVLLVEDNADSRSMLRDLLALWGHEVREAEDGPTGLEQVGAWRPDVALIDIGLPIMNGYEVARTVRAREDGHRPFLVALTGYGRPEDRRRALEVGFDAHLVKPVDLAELERLLSQPTHSPTTTDSV
jgi:signal transduction histidine kinase/ActR/RegA family two-component response regulator